MSCLPKVAMLLFFAPMAAHAMDAGEKGDPHRTDDCVDTCIATQRSCVVKAVTLADKSKCTDENSSCSTKCPLPNGGEKKSK